jgi:hypothetical protein
VQKNVMQLSDEEIKYIAEGRIEDKLLDAEVEEATTAETGGGDAGAPGGGDDEAGGLFSADLTTGDLLVGDENIIDDEDPDDKLSIDDDDAPIKFDRQIKNVFGEPIRKRKNRLGPGYLQMPDMANITGIGSTTRSRDTSNQPFETVANNFADLLNDDIGFASTKPRLSSDVANALSSLDSVISNKVRVLKETDNAMETLGINNKEEDQSGTP